VVLPHSTPQICRIFLVSKSKLGQAAKGHWDNEPINGNTSLHCACANIFCLLAVPYQNYSALSCHGSDKNDDGGWGWNTSPAENIALSESLLDLQALRYSDLSDVTVRRCSLALSTFCVMVITNKGRDFVVQCIYLPLFFPCRKCLQLLCCVVGRSSIGHCVASQ